MKQTTRHPIEAGLPQRGAVQARDGAHPSPTKAAAPSRGKGALTKAEREARRRAKLAPSMPQAGHEGRFEAGTALVDDPYERGAKMKAAINVRHDVLIHWHSRRQVDDAQLAAGRRFQAIYQRAEIGGARGIRYDSPKVDGGFPHDPLTEKVMEARHALSALAGVLGVIDYPLVSRIVGEGRPIEAEAATGHWPGKEPEKYVARRVRDALDTLANHWGATGLARAPVRGTRAVTPEGAAFDERGRQVAEGEGFRWGRRVGEEGA